MKGSCYKCNNLHQRNQLQQLKCSNHFLCKSCFVKSQSRYCPTCHSGNNQIVDNNQLIRNYPIQGIMVHHHKIYCPDGQSEFKSIKNCHGRTPGWILVFFWALLFFFSGIAMAIASSEKGTGVIMAIVGTIGICFSIYFICKIRKIDRQFESSIYREDDRFIYIKQEKRMISSEGQSRHH